MIEKKSSKNPIKLTDIPVNKYREARPKSTKLKHNDIKINGILNSMKLSLQKNPYNLRYSIEKTKYNKNDNKLTKILLSNDYNNSLKYHKIKMQENECKILLSEDKKKTKKYRRKNKSTKKNNGRKKETNK